jgi:putative ABC transport system permease protein
MEFGPIWRAALRNKTGVALIMLQVAFTMAIVVNAIAIAQKQADDINRPSGVDEANMFHLQSTGFAAGFNDKVTIEEDLRLIRSQPGVVAAIQTNSVPLSGSGWSNELQMVPGSASESIPTALYFVDEQAVDTYGVELVAGENFAPSDVTWRAPNSSNWSTQTIISKALATKLFPDDANYGVGKTIYINEDDPVTIRGVIDRLQAPWSGWDEGAEHSALLPLRLLGNTTSYLVRTEPGRRDELMPRIEQLLAERENGRILRNLRTMEETRKRSYENNTALVNILATLIIILVAITTLGIAGLTSFNVTRRTKQIGTRRALGASRKAILRYFLAENLLVTGIGVALGALVGVGLNIAMVNAFSIPRFDWYLLPAAMVVMLVIGQLAVLVPARRAAAIPPALATRTI